MQCQDVTENIKSGTGCAYMNGHCHCRIKLKDTKVQIKSLKAYYDQAMAGHSLGTVTKALQYPLVILVLAGNFLFPQRKPLHFFLGSINLCRDKVNCVLRFCAVN